MKKKYALSLFFCTALLGCTMCSSVNDAVLSSVVKELDAKRYMGVWYEIARFPHSFEKGLAGVTATYTLRDDGRIDVLNQGYDGGLDGKLKQAHGKAKIPNPAEPGKLRVAFFLFFYADYLVLDLDKDYRYAMIGSNNMDYLWILSRTPRIEPQVYDALVAKARRLGYDISKLGLVEQR
jgi:apolipoprotein D and lipocalin family protein